MKPLANKGDQKMLNSKDVETVDANHELVFSAMQSALHELQRVKQYMIQLRYYEKDSGDAMEIVQGLMEDFSEDFSTWRQQHMGNC